jgi:hypothetical protein
MIGRWYDPIEGRWHVPKPPSPASPAGAAPEDDESKERRLARERAIWDALTATAQASQQEAIHRDQHLAAD